jgi:predicted dehydrogenase
MENKIIESKIIENKKVNWGVISCAGIAEHAVIPGILQSENAVLYGLSSRSSEKLLDFSEKFKPVKSFSSYDDLLDDPNIDAVYIPLPNSLHIVWAMKAAMKNKHVLCEKPLAMSAEEVVKIKNTFDEKGLLFMEAFASRHNPLLAKVKSLLDEGVIGQLKFIESHFSFNLQDRSNIRYDKALGGGATLDAGAYTIGNIRYLVGSEPIEIHSVGEIDAETQIDLNSCVLMTFEGGITAVSYCSFNTSGWSGYTLVGTKGRIEGNINFNGSGQLQIDVIKDDKRESISVMSQNNYM